jgi:hypothetical protein
MINLTIQRFLFAQRVPLWVFFMGLSFATFAQQKEVVKETLTNKNYANTTEVHKTASATDAEVLSKLEGNYGIGDEVRISVAPPPKATDSLSKKDVKQVFVQSPLPTIPEGDESTEVSSKGLESTTNVSLTDSGKVEKASNSKAFVFEEPKKERVLDEKKERTMVSKSNKSATSSKGFYSAKKLSKGERFLFFFKKKPSKPKVTYHNRGGSKYGCYKF